MKVALLLLAAGRGTRFGGEVPKGFLRLGGKTLLERSAERLRALCPEPEGELIVLVGPQDRTTLLPPLMGALHALSARIVDGGETRQQSMQNGLAAASSNCDVVLVHDAARPLFPLAAARTCIDRARAVGQRPLSRGPSARSLEPAALAAASRRRGGSAAPARPASTWAARISTAATRQ